MKRKLSQAMVYRLQTQKLNSFIKYTLLCIFICIHSFIFIKGHLICEEVFFYALVYLIVFVFCFLTKHNLYLRKISFSFLYFNQQRIEFRLSFKEFTVVYCTQFSDGYVFFVRKSILKKLMSIHLNECLRNHFATNSIYM